MVLLRVAAAIWGTAIGIALLPLWTRPAPPGQLPGFATSLNIDAGAPMHFIAALALLPILLPFVLQPLLRRLTGWAAIAAATAMIAALWQSLIDQNVAWTIIPAAIVIGACTILRNVDAHFTRRDVILIPTLLAILLALIDLTPLGIDKQFVIAAMIVFALRLALPTFAFTFAPLAMIFNVGHHPWPALAIAIVAPFVTRRRIAPVLLAWLIYPIALYSYAMSTNLLAAEGKPRANFFEDAHGLVPASEMLRGERPYRDILPAHGLLEDGLLDYATFRLGGATAGAALRSRSILGALNTVAIYALGAAATGSIEAGVLSYFFGALFGIVAGTFRVVPHLFALALLAAALRLRRPRLLAYAGALTVLCLLTSLDFGAYTLLALIIAAIRMRSARETLFGLLAAAIPVLLIFVLFGIAGDAVRQTLFELRAFGPPATLTPFSPPPIFKTLRFFPEVLGGVFDKSAALMIFWIAATIFAGVTLTMRVSRRVAPLMIIALWIAVAGASYAARHHLHFQFALPALLIGGAFAMQRTGNRLAIPLAALLFVISNFTSHLLVISGVRHATGPLDASFVEIGDIPRARGALFTRDDAATAANAKLFADQHLGPKDTFFDFTNRPMLYFLLDRDCPIRDLGPAWYEPQSRQREVIAAIDRNPHVRAALIDPTTGLDNVPNEIRAPLVWAYLQQHFEPRVTSGNLVFWMRK